MLENINLIKPSPLWKKEILAYKEEFKMNPEDLHGTSTLATTEDIETWLVETPLFESRETLPNKHFVPSYKYMLVKKDTNKILGMINLRVELNDYLLNFGGNIGYSVAPSERKKGYGNLMLKETLKIARTLNLEKVLITCDDDNPASAKVIENNQGILENKLFDEESKKEIRRYWITLKSSASNNEDK